MWCLIVFWASGVEGHLRASKTTNEPPEWQSGNASASKHINKSTKSNPTGCPYPIPDRPPPTGMNAGCIKDPKVPYLSMYNDDQGPFTAILGDSMAMDFAYGLWRLDETPTCRYYRYSDPEWKFGFKRNVEMMIRWIQENTELLRKADRVIVEALLCPVSYCPAPRCPNGMPTDDDFERLFNVLLQAVPPENVLVLIPTAFDYLVIDKKWGGRFPFTNDEYGRRGKALDDIARSHGLKTVDLFTPSYKNAYDMKFPNYGDKVCHFERLEDVYSIAALIKAALQNVGHRSLVNTTSNGGHTSIPHTF